MIDDNFENFSDHLPISIHLKLSTVLTIQETPVLPNRVAWRRLTDNEIRTKYTIPVEHEIRELAQKYLLDLNCNTSLIHYGMVDTVLNELTKSLVKIANSNLPKSLFKPHVKPYWSKDLNDLKKAAKTCWRTWTDNGRPRDPDCPIFKEYKAAKSCYRAGLRRAKHKYNLDSYNDIIASSEIDQRAFWNLVNRKRTKVHKPKVSKLKSLDNLVSDPDCVLNIWREHFCNLATPSDNISFDNSHKVRVEAEIRQLERNSINNKCQFLSQPFTFQEVLKVCKKLKLKKKGGIDNCDPEHFKYGGGLLCRMLTIIFNNIVGHEHIPTNFHTAMEIPLFKGGTKDPHNIDSYRKISLMTIGSKMFESLIVMRSSGWFNSQNLGELQGAAIQGCSNLHTSFIVQESAAAYRDCGHDIFIAFLDTRKAFDTVWHAGLFQKLYHAGINSTLWRLLKRWYSSAKSIVCVSGKHSDPFHVRQGVRQGGVLSMKLYQLYIADLLKEISRKGHGCSLYGDYIGSPCYADDLALVTMFPSVLQQMLNLAYNYSLKWRYTYNASKSQVLIMANPIKINNVTFKLGNTEIPTVKETTHVGIPLSNTGYVGATSVLERISKGRRAFYSVCGINPNQRITVPTVLSQLYWSMCVSCMLYGCEVTVLRIVNWRSLNHTIAVLAG